MKQVACQNKLRLSEILYFWDPKIRLKSVTDVQNYFDRGTVLN